MDAYLSSPNDLSYSDEHPIIVVATSDAAMARAERAVQASDFRIGARLPVGQERARLAQQGRASALWLEIDRDLGGPLDELLDEIAGEVRQERYAAVISTSTAMLDAVAARVDEAAVEIIVEPDDVERAAALATVTSLLGTPRRINDIAADKNAERLRQLSEEVSRIASTLARLSTGPGAALQPAQAAAVSEIPPLPSDTVRKVIRARRLRASYFSEELFADPAWDMMLDLLQAEITQLRVPVSSLCIAAAVPATTALRWLKALVSQGLFLRRADPHDGRRVFVELAPQTSEALRRYFGEVGQVAVI
jgi:DNA-binding MarR family transcriptional regulator